MKHSLYRFALLTAYQFTIALGILMLPVALATSRVGVTPRVDPLLERIGTAYEDVAAEASPER